MPQVLRFRRFLSQELLSLKFVGFDQNITVQAEETMINLRIADIIIPIATALLAIWVMYKYGLSERKAKEIKATLVERRGEL